jgi:hypothetical protein
MVADRELERERLGRPRAEFRVRVTRRAVAWVTAQHDAYVCETVATCEPLPLLVPIARTLLLVSMQPVYTSLAVPDARRSKKTTVFGTLFVAVYIQP